MSKLTKRALLGGGLAFGCLVIFYVVALLVLLFWKPPELENWYRPRVSQQFVKAKWNDSKFGDAYRYKAANDLLRTGALLGKSEQEIRSLLGQPSSEGRFVNGVRLGYDLVPQRDFPAECELLPNFMFLNMDSWLLEIECVQQRVTSVRIRFT